MRAIALAIMLSGDPIVAAIRHVPYEPNGVTGFFGFVFLICLIWGW